MAAVQGWCRRGWFSIQCKCNIFKYPRLPTPPARAPWTVAASRLEQYSDGRAVAVLLKTRVKSEQTLLRNRVWKSRSWWQYHASPTTQPQIMDTKGAIARRMRSSRKRCVCVPDVPATIVQQPSSEVPVRPTSPCLLLALRRRAAPSREKELFDIFR